MTDFQKTALDRREAAEKVKSEAAQLKRFFHKRSEDMADFDSPFDALALLAEVLGSDEEMLFLDIGTLVKRYPDVTYDQVGFAIIKSAKPLLRLRFAIWQKTSTFL